MNVGAGLCKDHSVPPEVYPALGEFLVQGLLAKWIACLQEAGRCRVRFSEDSVHELRVASRRLISHLLLLEPMVHSPQFRKLNRELKRWLNALGGLRDAQVKREYIEQHLERFPELRFLRKGLKRRERQLMRAARRKLDLGRTGKVGEWVAALASDPEFGSPGAHFEPMLAASIFRRISDAFAEVTRRRQAIDPSDPRTIHRTRVGFKRFRYMVESVSPVLTGLTAAQLRLLSRYQRKMGQIQDLEVLQGSLTAMAERNPDVRARLLPFCRYLQQERARSVRSFLKSADQLHDFWPPDKILSRAA